MNSNIHPKKKIFDDKTKDKKFILEDYIVLNICSWSCSCWYVDIKYNSKIFRKVFFALFYV